MAMVRKARRDGAWYRNYALTAAKDLGYGADVLKDIRSAKTDEEIDKIMCAARMRKFK